MRTAGRRQVIYSSTPIVRTEPAKNEPPARKKPLRRFYGRFERLILVGTGALSAISAVVSYSLLRPVADPITQGDIDAAVQFTLESTPPEPSPSSVAYEIIKPSVVRVEHRTTDPDDSSEDGVGTGVIIEESGTILTNLHVAAGAERLVIIFADGFESDAEILSIDPDQDLAVIRAIVTPEGLVPATLSSTADLRLGDEVVAVGHPFGIGPSVSAGVISGLGRTYVSADGERLLSNMIQFDAAVNPGNSGGPLINRRGEVIGIVTAIYNPTDQRFFVGLGFAVPIETAAGAAGRSPF